MNREIFLRLLGMAAAFSAAQNFHPIEGREVFTAFRPIILGFGVAASFLPFSRFLAWGLVGAIFTDFFILLPGAPNHRHLLFFLASIFALSLLRPSKFESHTLPAIRLTSIIVYIFAFTAKLNWDYVNPGTSCSIEFYQNMKNLFGFFPEAESVEYLVIWGSLAVEGLLLFLLIYRPTWGIILGAGFHAFLVFDLVKYFINFSSVMLVCLAAFFPADSLEIASKKNKKVVQTFHPYLLLGSVSLIALGYYFQAPELIFKYQIASGRMVLWFLVFFLFIMVGISALKTIGTAYKLPLKLPGFTSPELVILGLVLLNGLSPYLGLKTRTSFNMYSNMHITSTDSNHFLAPRSLDVFGNLQQVENGYRPSGVLVEKFASFRRPRKPGEKCVW